MCQGFPINYILLFHGSVEGTEIEIQRLVALVNHSDEASFRIDIANGIANALGGNLYLFPVDAISRPLKLTAFPVALRQIEMEVFRLLLSFPIKADLLYWIQTNCLEHRRITDDLAIFHIVLARQLLNVRQ